MRGLWLSYFGEEEGAIHRIEQCGDRIVFTHEGKYANAGIIHDMRADGTYENGVDDVMDDGSCRRVTSTATIVDGKLVITRNPDEMFGMNMGMSWGVYPGDKLESSMNMMGIIRSSRWQRICELPIES